MNKFDSLYFLLNMRFIAIFSIEDGGRVGRFRLVRSKIRDRLFVFVYSLF